MLATVGGGAAALAIAWVSKSRTSDRRLPYSAWSTSAILAAFIALPFQLGRDAQLTVIPAVMFVVFLATVTRLNR